MHYYIDMCVYTCLSVASCLSLHRIVQQFENIVEALIEQENFTNVSVIAEDVALVGERVSDCDKYYSVVWLDEKFTV